MLRYGLVIAAVLASGLVHAPALDAQARPPERRPAPAQAQADVIARMRADFAARRFAAVIARGNALLESSRVLTNDEKLRLWEVLAAAYYPREPSAQQADSARLPLAALVRLVPDIRISPGLSWPGLDELLERTRSEMFSVAARPQEEYTIGRHTPARVTVVASRPAHFLLTTVSLATGEIFVHDSARSMTTAMLALQSHDGDMPVFQPGAYELRLSVHDVTTGDSSVIVREATVTGPPLPEPGPVPGGAPVVPAPGEAIGAEPAAVPAAVPGVPRGAAPAVRMTTVKRSTLVIGSLAFAGTAIAIATSARADEPLRSTFSADSRVYVVSAAMLGAAATALFVQRGRQRARPRRDPPPVASDDGAGAMSAQTRAAQAARLAELRAAARLSYLALLDEYRVTLRIRAPER